MNNQEKAEKALKGFLKELGKRGFTKSIKKHLNLVWQEDEVFTNALKRLEKVKYKVGSTKFISYNSPQKMYRFEVEINKETTNIFVQPLHEPGVPSDTGHWGVIPVKLNKFSKILKESIEEISKDVAKISVSDEEKEHQEIYLQYLNDGGKAEDFEDWLKSFGNKDVSLTGEELKKSVVNLLPKKASKEEILQNGIDNFKKNVGN